MVEAIEVVAAVHVGDHHGVAHVAVGAVAPRAESVGSGKKGKQWEINFTCHLEIMGRGAELEFQTLQQHGKQFFFSIRLLISTANRLIGEVVQSRRRPLLGPSPG